MRSFLFLSLFLLCFTTNAPAMLIVSTFDVDEESWTASGALVSHQAAGGNPGGFLRIEDNRDDTFSVFAPAKFKGNLLPYDNGLLSYDIIVLDPTSPLNSIGSGFGRIQLQGGGSNATFDYAPNPPIPSAEFWKAYSVPMTANAWNTTQENWETILSGVTNIDIILEPNNITTVGLDNFQVQSAIPEPATISLLSLGLLGMFRKKHFGRRCL